MQSKTREGATPSIHEDAYLLQYLSQYQIRQEHLSIKTRLI